jgi:Tat protein secretion system quality control protein TatD with DNase activity
MSIIDCHIHLNNYDEINKTENKVLSLEERLNALLESMEDNGIAYSLILSSYKVDVNRPSTAQIIESINLKNVENKIGVVAGYTIDNHTQEDLINYREWIKDGII